ncbi:MAG: type II toxin-antitoxin system Phd/YefM family antitoxin [Acidobacteria bacterium]|nr:type II toxin-antitoxin system Phd/YefM family antitoxin [Acidobacteriota bacterium]
MKRIGAAEFKTRCLTLLDEVGPEGLIITKHGKPVAKLMPMASEPAALVGSLKGRIRVKGRILSTGVVWRAGA